MKKKGTQNKLRVKVERKTTTEEAEMEREREKGGGKGREESKRDEEIRRKVKRIMLHMSLSYRHLAHMGVVL